jgi:FMN-dependent NADH-azoreductase
MPIRILRLDTSVSGPAGQSSQLADLLLSQLEQQGPIEVTRRDLAQDALPPISGAFFAALTTPAAERDAQAQAWVALADQLIEELRQAQVLVVAAPMYNFGIPSALKVWMDYVARAGSTFRYTPQGPEGLLADRPVFIQSTRGGLHQGTPRDSIQPQLTSFFNLLGLKDLRFTLAEGLNMAEVQAQQLAQAQAELTRLAQQPL